MTVVIKNRDLVFAALLRMRQSFAKFCDEMLFLTVYRNRYKKAGHH
jgi:hypothetical protein